MTSEEERLKRLRKEMREQDERRFQDPDTRSSTETIYVLLVWRRKRWVFISHTHGRITPKRVSQLRRKFRRQIPEDSILRLLDVRVYRASGAGAPPQVPPRSKRPARLAQQSVAAAQAVIVKRRRIPSSTKWGRCWKCSHRSLWYVAFTSRSRRILRKCCTRHAWHDQHLPSQAKCVVVVQRQLRMAA